MQTMTSKRRGISRALVALLSVALVFTMMPLSGGSAYKAHAASAMEVKDAAVVVTGQGLLGGAEYTADNVGLEKSYSLDELKSMDGVKGEMYSAKKQKSPFTKSYFIADGVNVSSLLDAGAYSDEITFYASDGYW